MTRSQRTTRRWGRLRRLAVVPFALMVILPLANMAGAANAPKVKVTPAKELGDGQYVRVSWTGLSNGQPAFFRQCDQGASNLHADCTSRYQRSAPSNGKGEGVTYLPITQGDVGAENGGEFRCDDSNPCTIAVLVDPDTLEGGGFGVLRYAPSPTSCPDLGEQTLLGAGSSSAYLAISRWLGVTCKAPHNLPLQYSMNNSPSGRDSFVGGAADFAATAEPFTLEEQERMFKEKRAFTYVPVAQSSLVLAYRIYQQDTDRGIAGPQITDLRLTPSAVARAFTGQNKNWRLDKEVNALNPKHRGKFPPLVRALPRAEHSAATRQFVQWLTATAPAGSLPKDWATATGATPDTWPSHYLGVDQGILGADHVALAMANPQDSDFYAFGYIGYMDASLAEFYGLPTALIQNAAGKFVRATPKTVGAGLKRMKKYADGTTLVPNYRSKDPNAYPLPTVNYIAASTNTLEPERATLLGDYLSHAVGVGQQGELPLGYLPLSKGLKAQATTAIAAIEQQDGKPTEAVDPYATKGPGGSKTCPVGEIRNEDGDCEPPPGGSTIPPTPPGGDIPGETPDPGLGEGPGIDPACIPTEDTTETTGEDEGESTPPAEGESEEDGATADESGAPDEAEGKEAEGKEAEGKEAEGKEAEGKEAEGKEAEGKEAEGKEAEGKEAEGKEAEGKEAEGKEAEGKEAEGKEAEGKEAEGKEAEADCATAGGFTDMEFPSTTASTARLVTMSLGALGLMGLAVGPGMQATARGEDLRRFLHRFTRKGPGGVRR